MGRGSIFVFLRVERAGLSAKLVRLVVAAYVVSGSTALTAVVSGTTAVVAALGVLGLLSCRWTGRLPGVGRWPSRSLVNLGILVVVTCWRPVRGFVTVVLFSPLFYYTHFDRLQLMTATARLMRVGGV